MERVSRCHQVRPSRPRVTCGASDYPGAPIHADHADARSLPFFSPFFSGRGLAIVMLAAPALQSLTDR
jgi:hypothetical protein